MTRELVQGNKPTQLRILDRHGRVAEIGEVFGIRVIYAPMKNNGTQSVALDPKSLLVTQEGVMLLTYGRRTKEPDKTVEGRSLIIDTVEEQHAPVGEYDVMPNRHKWFVPKWRTHRVIVEPRPKI